MKFTFKYESASGSRTEVIISEKETQELAWRDAVEQAKAKCKEGEKVSLATNVKTPTTSFDSAQDDKQNVDESSFDSAQDGNKNSAVQESTEETASSLEAENESLETLRDETTTTSFDSQETGAQDDGKKKEESEASETEEVSE